MTARSHLMIRPKQQLQNQLLMNFRKKNRTQVQNSQSYSQRFYTPNQNNQNSLFMTQNNRSILDQFSKCPIREDQALYSGQIFLNKFMYTKNRPVIPTSAKTSVSVQTQKHNEQNCMHSEMLMTKTKFSREPPNTKTPPKVTDFDQKQEKSIIDVSGNLSNYKFPISGNKNQQIKNRILTDSILGAPEKQEKLSSQDSAQQLLKQLQSASQQSLSFIQPKKEVNQVEKSQPIIKKIQLNRPRNKSQNQQNNKVQQTKQNYNNTNNNNKNEPKYIEAQDQNDQKLQKLLLKKSLIKNLIVKKGEENRQKQQKSQKVDGFVIKNNMVQKNLPQIQILNINKWNKPLKKYENDQKITYGQKPFIKKLSKQNKQIDEIDPLDLLPPYETSSSGLGLGLQAVIEQQNQSQMEESVKNKTDHKNLQNQKINQKKLFQSLKNVKPQLANENKQPLIIKSKKDEVKQIKNESFKNSSQKSLKQISLGDLSLEDLSEIQKQSGNKKLPDTFKKMAVDKNLDDQLPDYQDSDLEEKPTQQKLNIHKYIVNDISNDIKNLHKKISKDASLQFDEKPKQNILKVPKQPIGQQKSNKNISQNGSQGPDKKMTSMLDFFDEIHDKLDFNQISKDIIDLRDRIANDSQ